MTTIKNLLEEAADKIRYALYMIDQGYHLEANIDSYTVPEDVNEIFETFPDFKACVLSAFPDIVGKGEFIDDSEAYIDDDAKRHVYYWASLPKYGEDFVEYDTGAVKNFRWTIQMAVKTAIYQGTRRAFGTTFGEAIDNLYTCQSPTILNQQKLVTRPRPARRKTKPAFNLLINRGYHYDNY